MSIRVHLAGLNFAPPNFKNFSASELRIMWIDGTRFTAQFRTSQLYNNKYKKMKGDVGMAS